MKAHVLVVLVLFAVLVCSVRAQAAEPVLADKLVYEPISAEARQLGRTAYPVWRIMYEEGHCPGVLWEDYMCDGFVTETQKRELRIFRESLRITK